jgi:hypothetical protein
MEGCCLAVWDGKCRRKTALMMEGNGVALMGCEEMTAEKVKGDGGL